MTNKTEYEIWIAEIEGRSDPWWRPLVGMVGGIIAVCSILAIVLIAYAFA